VLECRADHREARAIDGLAHRGELDHDVAAVGIRLHRVDHRAELPAGALQAVDDLADLVIGCRAHTVSFS